MTLTTPALVPVPAATPVVVEVVTVVVTVAVVVVVVGKDDCKEMPGTDFCSFKRDSSIWRWYSRDLGASFESFVSFFSGETGMLEERSERMFVDIVAVIVVVVVVVEERLSDGMPTSYLVLGGWPTVELLRLTADSSRVLCFGENLVDVDIRVNIGPFWSVEGATGRRGFVGNLPLRIEHQHPIIWDGLME